MVEVLEPNFKFSDERGSLTQLVREGYRQVNIITSKAGIIRGGHYHKLNREAFYIIKGSLDLIVSRDDINKKYHFSKGEMFAISPLTAHAFDFPEDTIMISMYDKGVEMENGEKDIYPN